MGAYGRIRPGRFIPPVERAFTRECLRAAGAEEFAHKRFAELSGGQKQRVLIARALTTRPDVLVLDEPTAGVDHAATHAVLEFISQIRKERNIAVLLVTHDFAAVRKHAGRVIWLHEGEVLHGAADELLTPRADGGNTRNGGMLTWKPYIRSSRPISFYAIRFIRVYSLGLPARSSAYFL